MMRLTSALAVAAVTANLAVLGAQEEKKVPKDSVRVSIPGCSKGYIFTAGPRSEDQQGSADVPVGTHFRMNGEKKLINEIKAHEGSVVVLTGIVKKDQPRPGGVSLGGGISIGPAQSAGGRPPAPGPSQAYIDVEGYRLGRGECAR